MSFRKRVLIPRARQLNENLAASEVWFRDLYLNHKLKIQGDRANRPVLGRFIGDIVNRKLGYVIEVDGSIHERKEQQEKDRIKDMAYQKAGLKVIRVKAYDMESFLACKRELLELRKLAKKRGIKFKRMGLRPVPDFASEKLKRSVLVLNSVTNFRPEKC